MPMSDSKMRLAIRGYTGRRLVFEDHVEVMPDADLSDLVERHSEILVPFELFTIEIEFLDEPDQTQRYFRFGTETTLMRMPLKISL